MRFHSLNLVIGPETPPRSPTSAQLGPRVVECLRHDIVGDDVGDPVGDLPPQQVGADLGRHGVGGVGMHIGGEVAFDQEWKLGDAVVEARGDLLLGNQLVRARTQYLKTVSEAGGGALPALNP